MHVVIVSEYCRPWPGGISEHVFYEAEGLLARGHRVSVISGPGSERAGFSPAVTVVALTRAVSFGSNGAAGRLSIDVRLARLGATLRQLRPDVLHVHAPFDLFLPVAAVLASPVPVVGTFHASFDAAPAFTLMYHRHLPWVRAATRRLVEVIAVSAEAKRSIEQYVHADYGIIPNGVDLARFSQATGNPCTTPTILFVGRPDPRKGLPWLFDAFASLHDVALSVVGPVTDEQRRALLRRLPPSAAARVSFHGYVEPQAMARHFKQATVLCAPSLGAESQGIVLLEGFAAGLTVVASDIPGYREVIAHEVNGLLVPRGSVAAMSEALRRACGDTALQARLAAAATKTAASYAWEAVVERIEQRLLAAAARARPAA